MKCFNKIFHSFFITCLFFVTAVLGFEAKVIGTGIITNSESSETLSVKDTSNNIQPGNTLLLDSVSSAVLQLSDNSHVRLKPNSIVTFRQDSTILLKEGTVAAQIAPDSSRPFIMETPEVRITVKGTKFAVKVVPDAFASFAVLSGAILLNSDVGSRIMLNEGQKSKKNAGQPLSSPADLSQADRANLARLWEDDKPAGTAGEADPAQKDSVQQAQVSTADSTPSDDMSAKVDSTKADSSQLSKPAKDDAAAESKSQQEAKAKSQPAAAEQAEKAPPDSSAKEKEEKPAKEDKKEGIQWEIGLGMVTVDGKQWQRINISPDIPVWKFGICLDLEFFIDDQGEFSKKGWEFDGADQALHSVSRKIKYIRFGKSGEPVFVKLGAIEGVSMGYGLVMSGFGNTFEYPDYKRLGFQFELNNISPVKLGIQAVVNDLQEVKNQASVVGLRLSTKPFGSSSMPLLNKLEIGAMVAADENQYKGLRDSDADGVPNQIDDRPYDDQYSMRPIDIDEEALTDSAIVALLDSLYEAADDVRTRNVSSKFDKIDRFAIMGFDIGLPLIQSGLLGVTVYGQYAMNLDFAGEDVHDPDTTKGWGIAAPGVLLKAGPFNGNLEFRHLQNRFKSSYFNGAYERERLIVVGTDPVTKESTIDSVNINGVFASIGAQLGPVAGIGIGYQHLMGNINGQDGQSDKELTGQASLGELIIQKVPKLESAMAYFSKSRIGQADIYDSLSATPRPDDFFEKSPYMTYGYKVGFEISAGIVLIWDRSITFVYNSQKQLVEDPRMNIQTAIRF